MQLQAPNRHSIHDRVRYYQAGEVVTVHSPVSTALGPLASMVLPRFLIFDNKVSEKCYFRSSCS